MNKVCYKCGTTKELSKRGKTVMICKPCRREQYKNYMYGNTGEKPLKPISIPKPTIDPEWIDRAEASYKLILERRT